MSVLATPQVRNTGTLSDFISDRCQKKEDVLLFTREFYHATLQLVLDSEDFSTLARGLFPELRGNTMIDIKLWWEAMHAWFSAILDKREQVLFAKLEVAWV